MVSSVVYHRHTLLKRCRLFTGSNTLFEKHLEGSTNSACVCVAACLKDPPTFTCSFVTFFCYQIAAELGKKIFSALPSVILRKTRQ